VTGVPERTIDSYSGPATFHFEGGTEADVTCSYTVRQDLLPAGDELIEGLKSWSGNFTTDNLLVEPGTASLALPDGRTGEILISQVNTTMGTVGTGVRGRFRGNGSPPA
jgi:hypothetical protein